MYVIFIDDGSKYAYRAKDANGKTLTFASDLTAAIEADRMKASNPAILATTIAYEGKRRKKGK